jgi:endonuclease/exonuclease/phosphatase (EEP) superfamily protein YafD
MRVALTNCRWCYNLATSRVP